MESTWPEIGSADRRRELKISGKVLNGRLENDKTIPATLFVKLTALNFLELSEAPLLTSLPNELGRLSSLTNLILQGNQLEKLPDTLGELKKLKFLDASRNSLIELPSAVGGCIELQSLIVAHNQLRELPMSLAECGHVVHVDASHNQFESFPMPLINQKSQHLTEISLKSNRIIDIPTNVSYLAALKSLDLSENKILVVPGELGDCSKLKDLQLRGNELKDRRLRKLIEDGAQKAILDYIRKYCAKTTPVKKLAKSNAKAATAEKKAPTDEQHDGDEETEEDEAESNHPKDKIFVTPARSEVKIVWHKDVAEIRPYLLCCVLKNLDFGEAKTLKDFLSLQTKLHDNQCHRRVAATIATHDLSKIRFPLSYTAKVPEDISIHPLGYAKDTMASDLVSKLTAEAEQLRKEKKRQVYSGIHQYLYLVKDKPKYSCLVDADGRVISFPPITNSDLTKITTTTKHLLLEITSDKDAATCKRVMEALLKGVYASSLITATHSRATKCMTIEQVKVESEDDMLKAVYPSKVDLADFGEGVEIVRDWAKVEGN